MKTGVLPVLWNSTLIRYVFRSFSWLNLHCTWSRRHSSHLPGNFSVVESLSRLMVSTLCWVLHFSAEQTETVCLCLWLLFCFGLWRGGWGRRKGLLLGPISDHLPLPLYLTPRMLEHSCFASLSSFSGYKFQVVFLWQCLEENVWYCIWLSCVFTTEEELTYYFIFVFFTKLRCAGPCWAESRGNCVYYRSFPKKIIASVCEWPRVCPSGATIHWIYSTLRLSVIHRYRWVTVI